MAMKYEKGEFLTIPNKSALRGLSPNLQVLFFWLCDHADDDNVSFPSRQTLAAECGISIDTLDRSIKKLIDIGMVKKKARFNGNEQTTNLYQVIIMTKKQVTANCGGVAAKTTLGDRKLPTQNSTHLTLIDTKVSMGAEAPVMTYGDSEINAVFKVWADTTGKPIQRQARRNRLACYTLLKSLGAEKLTALIQVVETSKLDKYAPVITDFITLELKQSQLEAWIARNNTPSPALVYPNVGAMLHPEKYGKVAV